MVGRDRIGGGLERSVVPGPVPLGRPYGRGGPAVGDRPFVVAGEQRTPSRRGTGRTGVSARLPSVPMAAVWPRFPRRRDFDGPLPQPPADRRRTGPVPADDPQPSTRFDRKGRTVPGNGSSRNTPPTCAKSPSCRRPRSAGSFATTIRIRSDGRIMPMRPARKRSPRSAQPLPGARRPVLGHGPLRTDHRRTNPASPSAVGGTGGPPGPGHVGTSIGSRGRGASGRRLIPPSRFRRSGDGPYLQPVRPNATAAYPRHSNATGTSDPAHSRETRLPPASRPGIPNHGPDGGHASARHTVEARPGPVGGPALQSPRKPAKLRQRGKSAEMVLWGTGNVPRRTAAARTPPAGKGGESPPKGSPECSCPTKTTPGSD